MSLTLRESHAVSEMARMMYSFMPGSGFAAVAQDVGVDEFWTGGSKQRAIETLLGQTLDKRRQLFQRLVLAIVSRGLTRQAIRRAEIVTLNALLLNVSFKFPDLWDEKFLSSLPAGIERGGSDTAGPDEGARDAAETSAAKAVSAALPDMHARFYALYEDHNRQSAGLALEGLLNDLFRLFDLEPRPPFRVTGEQIDGSFELDHEIYLVEAKWVREQISESDLLVFRGKIEGKSAFTRGVFVSIHGFTQQAQEAITRGKQPNFFLVDGFDLLTVLQGRVGLPEMLRLKLRRLTEEGRVFVTMADLLDRP
ncbi:MAG: restriction endonuclease [Chloroflexi bacterium]|nr:restriction endonuclease [Bacteroidota bacterium]MCL5110971.1 restriction endonuclease [Chloroflexota bacterium]